ncbi:TonB-dependent receptor plug domain-containing protein [Pedobacter agri]|uniref:TonB-dependent receptor plug domain-containing protein n=1 Tax=Pedobacter agri TaxID=454586 RepID=UPI00293162E3|nr:TonB-dependent receptor plug domain-containing protein [Pedobacter agri]
MMKRIMILITALGCALSSYAQKTDSTTTPKITLRGVPTTTAEPLIVIDGNKQYLRGTNAMSGIDPNNIESINVLKDAPAITKYGRDGDGGVIEIKTKNGLAGIYNTKIDSNRINLLGKPSHVKVRPSGSGGIIKDLHQKSTDPAVTLRNLLQKDTDLKAKPLYVVDGKKITSIENLNPETIESISVLKDSAGKSLYGDEAANGVVIITTKTSTKEFQKKN